MGLPDFCSDALEGRIPKATTVSTTAAEAPAKIGPEISCQAGRRAFRAISKSRSPEAVCANWTIRIAAIVASTEAWADPAAANAARPTDTPNRFFKRSRARVRRMEMALAVHFFRMAISSMLRPSM